MHYICDLESLFFEKENLIKNKIKMKTQAMGLNYLYLCKNTGQSQKYNSVIIFKQFYFYFTKNAIVFAIYMPFSQCWLYTHHFIQSIRKQAFICPLHIKETHRFAYNVYIYIQTQTHILFSKILFLKANILQLGVTLLIKNVCYAFYKGINREV